MKAAILKELGKPLEIIDLDEPALLPGCVKIKVLSAHVLSYLHEVFSGDSGRRPPPVPYIPGPAAVGIIEDIAPDVSGLSIGETVFCHHSHIIFQINLFRRSILAVFSDHSATIKIITHSIE